MNDAELEEIAQAVVSRLMAGAVKLPDARKTGSELRDAKLRVVTSHQIPESVAAVPSRLGTTVPAASTSRPLEDISWRGPRMLAAWTPAAGARRVADFVDHTLLKPEATREDILKLCAEAREHRFAAVCVNPSWVDLCAGELTGTHVAVASVCGFPLGATTPRAKASEAGEVVSRGATEVDMVAALGRIKGGEWGYVEDDIRAVVEASRGALVKVIIESAILTPEEIVKASAVVRLAGGHFVKTSTGFHAAGGATADAVRLMRLTVGDDLGVKAAGGVRDCATALAMIGAGASRIGTSSGVSFVGCLGPEPLSLAELLKRPEAHAASCRSGSCAPPAGGHPY